MVVQFCDATYVRSKLWCHLCSFSVVMPPVSVLLCDAAFVRSVFSFVMLPMSVQSCDAFNGF